MTATLLRARAIFSFARAATSSTRRSASGCATPVCDDMPNQVTSILRLHAAMTGGGGEDASCLGAGIVDIGVGTALAAKQAVKIEGDEVLDVDGAVGSPDHETTRSVPPYNFGGTLSARGATCAMRTFLFQAVSKTARVTVTGPSRNLGAGDRKPHHGAADLARYAAK
jgi:hypothetical protein